MSDKRYNLVLALSIGYLLIIGSVSLWHREWLSPDQFFLVALFLTVFLGKWKQFIRDWSLPIILLFSYACLRGLVPDLSLKAHYQPMIAFDQWLFGDVPALTLQRALSSKDVVHWYDYIAVMLYFSHFIVLMVAGFILWLRNRQVFKDYASALVLLSYLAFITYVLFPAVPPWMASRDGVLPPLLDIESQVSARLANPISTPTLYALAGVNPVAAVPSLHAAYPLMVWLFAYRHEKPLGWILLPYVLGVWFAVIYLAQHYVFDIVTGILYALVVYFIVIRNGQIRSLMRRHIPILRDRRMATSEGFPARAQESSADHAA